ncbi:putative alpha-1,2-mannosidase [Amycolatopsis bartoniae]|uniref:Alpha-1,2-mannosidase n=1 Tax=Amycolatopsis bartoniae TaxID=941986 RepID=A0A8H9MCF6_9PSEU|nr:GH92 family glycosyl hydrolase [Amycolatopsis bartoniae]MBB2940075.1 putative alpha-1,2-mannosidase [Amycolatopsis bartoniae]TVT09446.1 glycoside hydrolase family 92 protein [Amycolatopsis bartoniae]GHF53773.1 alpha-1,2-mannosidase [Amycolatopsis bartoniae]
MRARQRVLTSLLAGVTLLAAAAPAAATEQGPRFADDPTTLVDTSIGNNGDGTTFPGATTPFGMVQLSPDTQLKQYASYDYAQDTILGFSHTHLSGVGCQTMGNFRFMPTTGAVTSSDPAQYGAKFSHANETRAPGYYGVKLDNGIDAELTATQRTGQHRYTYPDTATSENVLIEVGESNGYTYAGDVHVVGDDTVEGWLQGGNFCWETQKERYKIFFSAKFDRKFTSFGTWTDNKLTPNQRDASLGSQRTGAWLSFDPAAGKQVGASVGLSYTSIDGARLNRTAEQPKSFDKAKQQAHDTWLGELNRMRVAGGTTADQRTYYSALYRSLLHPSVGSDVDGAYRGFDDQVHRSRDTYYQMFSLWDTYRSQNQLVALLHPDKAADMTKSILKIYQDGGWVPRWALANGETNVMSGDPVTPWVVDNYRRGLLDDRTARQLFDALWRNATEVPADQSIFRGRDGNPTYVRNGWIGYQDVPGYTFGDTRQAGSATLEYALADCSLSTMAQGLGYWDKAKTLHARCDNFANLWDTSVQSHGFTGFPRARAADGTPVGSADPAQSVGFHEGTPWQYQWLAQQDPAKLLSLMGGPAQAEQRLDTFFDLPLVLSDPAKAAAESWVHGAYDYHNNFAFNPNNEPDLHSPWMYAWTGAPWKTSAVLRAARTLFTDTPYGMPGNDDLGTISSWLVFGMTGIFEAQPGSGTYLLSTPMFEKVEIRPEHGRKIEIEAPGASAAKAQYTKDVRIGAHSYDRSWISHADLLRAGTIRFGLSDEPTSWGTRSVPPGM